MTGKGMTRITTLAIAITPQEAADFLPEPILSGIRSLAVDCRVLDTAGLSADAFRRELAAIDPDVLVTCWSTPPLPADPPARLRYVCHITGGVRQLVTRAQLERGLILTNWGGSISRVVAECALLLALAALRRAGRWIPAMHAGAWRDDRPEGASLFGRRVGLHGFGQVARELTKLLAPFGVEIGVCAPEKDHALYAAHGARRVATLEELFAGHDVIFELAPLTPATAGIVTERLLRLIPAGGVFVNVARGKVVDEAALLRVAREGRIHVGLDVYATEPLPADSGFRGLPNAVLLPHIAGPTLERRCDAGAFALRNLKAYSEDRPLEAVITPEVFDLAP
jgi:phosphoglycerate dehydrogenase-like enzyme